MPDILSECLYELKWLLKMQFADGSVSHKLTSMRHACFTMPGNDKRQLILFPASSMATADFAAVMALASGIYRKWDADFAEKAFRAGQKAWVWLEKNPELLEFHNPPGCNTGEYGDGDDCDERFWAAVELYCLTGDLSCLNTACRIYECGELTPGLGWGNVAGFAGLALISLNDQSGFSAQSAKVLEQKLTAQLLSEAENVCLYIGQSGYMAAMQPKDFTWGSNMVLLNRSMLLAAAYKLTGERKYYDCALNQMNYLLGVNATGYSFISGFGERAVKNVHNRIFVADEMEEIAPGYVSGGPNGRPCDEKAEWLIEPGTPPMKCFLDVWECYSLNETAIYWNSPAIFLTAFLLEVLN